MLYLVEAEIRLPENADPAWVETLRAQEIARSHALQREGRLRALWRLAGRRSNVAIFDAADHDALHQILASLPMFPWLDIRVEPLARHPAQLDEAVLAAGAA